MLKITKRNLPHWELQGSVYFITFRLLSGKLSDEEIKIVKEHIIKGHDKYYLLYAAVVMNNHAHVIFQPVEKYTLS